MRTSEETKDITLLGQKNVKYEFNYRPDVLETFDNALSQVNQILVQFISLIFLMKKWWKVNP